MKVSEFLALKWRDQIYHPEYAAVDGRVIFSESRLFLFIWFVVYCVKGRVRECRACSWNSGDMFVDGVKRVISEQKKLHQYVTH